MAPSLFPSIGISRNHSRRLRFLSAWFNLSVIVAVIGLAVLPGPLPPVSAYAPLPAAQPPASPAAPQAGGPSADYYIYLPYIGKSVPGVTTHISPASGGTLTSPDQQVQVTFPAGAVLTNTTLTYRPLGFPEAPTGSLQFSGPAFHLDATDAAGRSITQFQKPFILTVRYTEGSWQSLGLSGEDALNVYYWSGSAWEGILPCAGCTHDPAANTFTLSLNHLTQFAVLGYPSPVDLSLSMASDRAAAAPGDTVRYTLSYSSQGNSTSGVRIVETLPAHATFNPAASSQGWVQGSSPSEYVYTIGALNFTASGSVTFAVQVASPLPGGVTEITNTAVISDGGAYGADATPADNTASHTVSLSAAPDLSISLSDAGVTALPAGVVVYTLTYANTGSQDAAGVILTETLPVHTAFHAEQSSSCWVQVSETSTYTCSTGSLPADGDPRALTFAVMVSTDIPDGVTSLANSASIADDGANGADLTPANNTADHTTPLNLAPDLSLAIAADRVTTPGGTVLFTINYANHGYKPAAGAALTASLPENTTYLSSQSTTGWQAAGGNAYNFPIAQLNPGDSGAITLALTVSGAAVPPQELSSVLSITDDGSRGPDPLPANNQVTAVTTVSATATPVCGNITAATTWTPERSPYIVTCDATLSSGITLTVQPGVTVYFKKGTGLTINGTLLASGSSADRITFGASTSSPTPGFWKGITINSSSANSAIQYADIQHGGGMAGLAGALRVIGAAIRLENSRIQASSTSGLYATSISTITLRDNHFEDNGAYAAYLSFSNGSLGQVSGNTASGNRPNALALSGSVGQNSVLALHPNLPYLISGALTINSGVSLTLPAGQVIKMESSGQIKASGALLSAGTAQQPVVITSLKDDTTGDDTNNDAAATSPAPGDWLGLYFASTSTSSLLEHTVVRYAGKPYVLTHKDNAVSSVCGGNPTYSGIYIDGGALTLRGSTLEQVNGTGVNVYQGSAVLENSLIHQIKSGAYIPGTGCDVRYYGYGVYGASATLTATGSTIQNNSSDGLRLISYSTAALSDNVFTGNSGYAVQLTGALLAPESGSNQATGNAVNGIGLANGFSGQSTLTYSNLPYVLSDFSVASGATLTLPAGQVLKFQPTVKFNIAGNLQAVGAEQNPILFTSLKDDAAGGDTNNDAAATSPAPGDWLGLYFASTSTGSLLEHTVVRYAGRPYVLTHKDNSISSYCGGESTYTGIYVDGGSLTLRNSTVTQVNGTGVNVYQGSAALENSLIHQIKSGEYVPGTGCNVIWYGYGIYGASATLTATGSTIQNNSSDGLSLISYSTATLTDNAFTGNGGYAVRLMGSVLSAESGSNQATGNAVNGIGLANGFSGQSTLTYSNLPYVLSEFNVASGATLTLPAGQVLKFQPGIKMNIAGNLQAIGAPQSPIIFTTLTDDTAGGDTNSDDAATAPALGEWSGLYFASTSTGSVLDNIRLRYAGKPYNLTHKDSAVSNGCGSLSTWSSIYVDQGSITLKNSQLMKGNGVAVNVYKGSAVVDNNLISLFFTGGNPGAPCGVLYYGSGIYSDQAALTVTNNWLTLNNYGIKILSALSAGISGNAITNNVDYGIYSVPVISAENNWWGEASGPAPFGNGNPINFEICKDSQGRSYICNYHVRAHPWVGITQYYGKAQPHQAFVADPVNTASGNYYSHHTDLSIPTRSIPLAFTRSYNSIFPQDGPLGYGWAHSYHVRLSESAIDQSVTIYFGDGHSERYAWDGAAYQPPTGVYTSLTRSGGIFTLTFKDQSRFVFNDSGNLAQIIDHNGSTTTLTYSGTVLSTVTAPDGRALTFSYLGSRVSRITDPLGRTVQFAYDGSGSLVTVTDADNRSTTYTYDTAHRLLTVTDANAHTFVTNVYDADGRVIEQYDAHNNKTTFAYDIANHRTTVTDPLLHTTVYQYDATLRLTTQTDGLNHATTYTYDTTGNLLSVTDPNNHATTYTYDARGNRLTVTDSLGGVTSSTYDAQNRLLTVTDALQRTIAYTYDASGNRLTETGPLNNVTTYTYYTDPDHLGLLHTATDALGRAATYEYDIQGNPTRVTNTLGQSTTAVYDAGGRKLSQTDARGHTWTYTYDPLNRLLTETDPLDHVTTYAYDPVGNRVSVEDANHKITQYAYNEKDQLVTVTDPAGYVTAYTYDAVGNKRSFTDGSSHTTTYGYDAANRLVTVTNPLNQVTTYGYDAAGNQTSVKDPLNHVTTTAHDALNRPISITDALGHAVTKTYDAVGNLLTSTDANGHTTHFTYTARGQLATVTDALGGTLQYTYDAVGNRTALQDANGHITRYQYDALNRLIETTNPLNQVTTHTYDENGNLLSLLDANGHTTTYQYDPANRLIKTQYDDGTQVTHRYDAVGNLLEMVDALGVTTYIYDDRYRALSITGPTGAASYTYDAAHRLTLTTPAGTTTYTYNDAGQMLTVTDWQNQVTTYTYNAAGRHTATTYPNGVSTTFTYDDANRPTGILTQKGEETLLEIQYTLDPAGNRLAMVDGNGVTTYTYDELNRLVSVAYPGGAPNLVEYTYDPTGNRLSMTRDSALTTYTYDAADRLLSTTTAGVTTPYTWDANGNLLARGSQSFTWDRANQLVRVDEGASTTTFQYDGSGARLGKTVNGLQTTYLQDSSSGMPMVVRETTGAETIDYVYGLDLVAQSGAGWSYYHADALGSTRLLTGAAGAAVAAYSYDAFGAARAQTGAATPSFTFAGQQMDAETGLFFLRARYYDPADGRFISSDRYPSLASQTQTINRYVYVQNNPVSLVDPTGNAWYDDVWNFVKPAVEVFWDFAVAPRLNIIHSVATCVSNLGNCAVESFDFLKKGRDTINHYQRAANIQQEMIKRISEGYTGNYEESFNDLQIARRESLRAFAASEADFLMSMPCTSIKGTCGLSSFIPDINLMSSINPTLKKYFGFEGEFSLKDLKDLIDIGESLEKGELFQAIVSTGDVAIDKSIFDPFEDYPGNSIRYYYSQFGQAEGGYFGGPPSQNK